MSVREDRLQAEYEAIRNFGSDVFTWEVAGSSRPPDHYYFYYVLRSISRFDQQGNPLIVEQGWKVEIKMPANYPWGKPEVRFVGECICHPNVWINGDICIEDNYRAGLGIPLDMLCEHIGQIIAFQKFNINNPANREPQLITWIQGIGRSMLPTDHRDIRRARISIGTSTPNPSATKPGGRIQFG